MAKDISFFLIAGVALFVAWILAFVTFKVTAGLIHLLLVAAVIAFIVAMVRRAGGTLHRRRTV